MKELYILRGLPGSGKTKLAESLLTNVNGVICSADDFLYNDKGEYIWTEKAVCWAHHKCMELFEQSLENNIDRIIISNINHKLSDVKYYTNKAKEYGYTVFSLIVENRHDGKNSHGVNESKMKELKNCLQSNTKLM